MSKLPVKILVTVLIFVGICGKAFAKESILLKSYEYSATPQDPVTVMATMRTAKSDPDLTHERNFGFRDEEGWFLFELKGKTETPYLYVKNPLFTSLRAFSEGRELERRTTGGLNYFVVSPKSLVLLAVKSNTVHDLNLELLNAEELKLRAGVHSLLIGLYALIICSLMVASLLSAIGEKDRTVLVYSTVILCFHGFAILSLFAFPINWLFFDLMRFKAWTIIASEGLACMTGLTFISVAIKYDAKSSLMRRSLFTVALVTVFFSFCYQDGPITLFTFVLCVLTIIAGAIMIVQNRAKLGNLKPYVVGFISIGSGTLIFALQYIGYLDLFEYRYVILFGAVIDVTLTLTVFLKMMRQKRRTRDRLHFELRGMASDEEIEKVFESSGGLSLKSRFANCSIMFIDLSRYSAVMEREDKDRLQEVEESLTLVFEALKLIAFQYKGIVNKSLGDGLLIYFGQSLNGQPSENHQQYAVECARAMHDSVINLIATGICKYPFAIRIGINAGRIRIGNLAKDRIDFTVIGHIVNLAKRFEAGAGIFETIVSQDIKSKVDLKGYKLYDKLIAIKNKNELLPVAGFSAYNEATADEFILAYQKYLDYHQFERREDRYQLNYHLNLTLSMPFVGEWRIMDFSKTGIRVLSSKNLCSKVEVRGRVGQFLLNAEVMWSRKADEVEGFYIGLLIKSFDDIEREAFVKFLSENGHLTLVRETNHFLAV